MNILFICNEYPPYPSGGIGIFTQELSIELRKSGHNVYIIGLYPVKNNTTEIVNDVKIIRIPKKKGISGIIYNRVHLYNELNKLIKKENIEILETPDFNGLLAFFPSLNCKIITRLHGSVYYFRSLSKIRGLKGALWYLVEKSSINKSNKIISVSDFTAEFTKKIFNLNSRIRTIHNGVCVNNSYTPKENFNKVKEFVFAGSLIKKKGIIELVKAWIIFSSNNSNVQLSIYGKDIEKLSIKLHSLLDKANCSTVKIHPPISKSELQKIYLTVDYCIFPTKAEAFSLAPMEAMAMSRVVLYTNQTSSNELILDGVNGIIIDSCCVDDIVNALHRANELKISEYNYISKNAYNTVNTKFNVKDKNSENIKFYHEVLNDKD
ncbi:glycosyltransferase family 4 protein [Providencia rettgeri]|uniref:glycosyltransferase family 4 protein n=1 Tax=Providencia sp. PROV158 TaxID=2949868 RepID=UPI00234B88A8|nr:glycosyltransferase family 4 protein [Providencia sp. PROV158]